MSQAFDNLNAAADALIAHCGDHNAELAAKQAELDAANAALAEAQAQVAADDAAAQSVADKLNGAASA